MNILIQTFACPFELEIRRLVGLFGSGMVLRFHHEGEPALDDSGATPCDVEIRLSVTPQGRLLQGSGSLQVSPDSPPYSRTFEKAIPDSFDSVAHRKEAKHLVLHVLYRLLVDWTGRSQPWGYLTGIRPTKLVHRLLEESVTPSVILNRLTDDYLVADDRAKLLLDIAQRQQQVLPQLYSLHDEVSIYIGIPFCPTHCAYCTFPAYSMVDKATYVEAFLEAMQLELKQLGELLRRYDLPVTSVYIGGGTPTSLRAFELEALLHDVVREIPGRERWRELTVEAGRPDTITPDRVKVMKDYGVDRVSVNPQTFKLSTLQHIRRGHTPEQVDHRFHYVREAGFENINMDMILGLPGETLEDVRYTMERIERLNPDSITVHTMSLKRTAEVKTHRDRFAIPEDDVVIRMMEETKEWIHRLQYQPYYVYRQMDILGNQENIGFAKPGKESIYNICIMEERQTIVGIGGGAVTKAIGVGGKHYGRLANPREPKAYIDTIRTVMEKKERLLTQAFDAIRRA